MRDSSIDWTAPEMIREVAELCNSKECPDKILVIALWDEKEENYDTKFWNVGMTVSEMIALMEIQKAKLLQYMERG